MGKHYSDLQQQKFSSLMQHVFQGLEASLLHDLFIWDSVDKTTIILTILRK